MSNGSAKSSGSVSESLSSSSSNGDSSSSPFCDYEYSILTDVQYGDPYFGGSVNIFFKNTGSIPIQIMGASGTFVPLDVSTGVPLNVNPGQEITFTVGSFSEDADMGSAGFTIYTTCGNFGPA
jgi:hypothetical protein